MTEEIKTMNKLEQLISEGKWTEFLHALPLDTPRGFRFPDNKAMDVCKVMAYKMNTRQDIDRQFKISLNYRENIFTITASAK